GIAIAVQRAPSGLAALVFGSVPLWTTLFDRLFWGGRLVRAELAGIALGVAGVALVSCRGALESASTAALRPMTAAAAQAPGRVLTGRWPLPPGGLGPATQMLSGGVLLLGASAVLGERASSPPRASVLALAYVVVFGSMLVYSVLAYLLRNARPALATSHAYV